MNVGGSAPRGAVFLSYASQDAEAAKRICEALRSAGVEVWFDQSELVGGDAWDAKIRKQIRECALFVPVISANTNARMEGYFRREWRLAVDRMHDMDDGHPFLLPVVIDDTSDAAARVPDRFRERQWTRLPGGETPPALAERVKQLLGGESVVGPVADRAPDYRSGPQRKRIPSRPWLAPAMLGVAAIVAVAVWQSWHRSETPVKSQPAAALAPQTDVQKLVARARTLALHDQWDECTRDDFALAEQLLKRALDLDPTDPDAAAAEALLSCGYIGTGFDHTDLRKDEARQQAERAVKLAPNSDQARFALAYSYRYQQAESRVAAVRMLRELAERNPTDHLILRTAGRALEDAGQGDEALQYFDRAAALPGGDAMALRMRADALYLRGRVVEAEAVIDRALALRPGAGHLYVTKIRILIRAHGDLVQARTLLAKIPPSYLLEDPGAYIASLVWLYSREPQKCLEVLNGVHRDYIEYRFFTGPKGLLAGEALQLAGRPEAAVVEWRAALKLVETRLAAVPNDLGLFLTRIILLAELGERNEAERALLVWEQLTGAKYGADAPMDERVVRVYLLLGRKAEAIRQLGYAADLEATGKEVKESITADLRLNPWWDPLRDEPAFKALLADKDAGGQRPVPPGAKSP